MKVTYVWSTSHWIMPRIIIGVLVVLAVLMLIERALKCKETGTPFINLKGYHFLAQDYDKLKFWGSIVLIAAYIFCMPLMGFLASSILYIFLLNVLFSGVGQVKEAIEAVKAGQVKGNVACKSLLVSLIVSVVASVLIWFTFGTLFQVTLP